jgi:exosortase
VNKIISDNKILLGIFTAGFIILFFPVLKSLIQLWMNSDDHSYGLFIFPISLYIMWQKKDHIAKIPVKPEKSGLLFVIMSLILYLLAKYADIQTLAPVSMVLFLFSTVIYILGYGFVKELIFPLCFLFFIVPIPSQIYSALTIPLQLFVTQASVFISGLFDIPLLREGNVIHLPHRTLQVVQACSGLRSLVSLLTLSAVFGYLTLSSNILRTILFLSGFPVAVFVNIFRVLLMILAFHYMDFDLTEDKIHSIFGLVVFGLALLLIAIIKKVLSHWDNSAVKE